MKAVTRRQDILEIAANIFDLSPELADFASRCTNTLFAVMDL